MKRFLFAFIAGFIAVLVFHQGMLTILHAVGFTSRAPFPILFGAIGPTLAAWFVAAPLKGQALAAGWKLAPMITGLLVNGAWGLGTGLFLRWFSGK